MLIIKNLIRFCLLLPLALQGQNKIDFECNAYRVFTEQNNGIILLLSEQKGDNALRDTIFDMPLAEGTITNVSCQSNIVSFLYDQSGMITWYAFRYYTEPNDTNYLAKRFKYDTQIAPNIKMDSSQLAATRSLYNLRRWKMINVQTLQENPQIIAMAYIGRPQKEFQRVLSIDLIDAMTVEKVLERTTSGRVFIIQQVYKLDDENLGNQLYSEKTLSN